MQDSLSEPNFFLSSLLDKLKRHPKRVVFPEAEDIRVLRVAAELVRQEAALPILLGNRATLKAMANDHGIPTTFINFIDPSTSSDLPLFCDRFTRMEGFRGIKVLNPEETLVKPHYFASMMVQYGQADAVVAGNLVYPTEVYRPLLHLIKPLPEVPAPFGAVILVDDREPSAERVLILADCSLHVSPSTDQLAAMAVECGKLARHILGRKAKIAMLSHSTKGSSASPSSRKMAAATALARETILAHAYDLEIEGEVQADAALVPAIADKKNPASFVHGDADVLIFPTLDASDIAVRLLRHLAGFKTYGQLVLGLARPAAQVPRGASTDHILGSALAVAVEAVKYHEIYPQGDSGSGW